MVKADTFHRSKVIEIDIMFYKMHLQFVHDYRKYADGDYSRLCNMLFKYEYSQVHSDKSVDAAAGSVSVAMRYSVFGLLLVVYRKNQITFLGFFTSLRYYVRKENSFQKRFREKNIDYLYSQFSKYRKLV